MKDIAHNAWLVDSTDRLLEGCWDMVAPGLLDDGSSAATLNGSALPGFRKGLEIFQKYKNTRLTKMKNRSS